MKPSDAPDVGAQGIDDGGHALVRHASGHLTSVGWRTGANTRSDYLAVRVNDDGTASCSAAGSCASKTAASCADASSCAASVCVTDAWTRSGSGAAPRIRRASS
jgi:hypothetical protein